MSRPHTSLILDIPQSTPLLKAVCRLVGRRINFRRRALIALLYLASLLPPVMGAALLSCVFVVLSAMLVILCRLLPAGRQISGTQPLIPGDFLLRKAQRIKRRLRVAGIAVLVIGELISKHLQ